MLDAVLGRTLRVCEITPPVLRNPFRWVDRRALSLSPSMAAMSSVLRVKSIAAKFSTMCAGVLVRGIAATPDWTVLQGV